MRHHPNIQKQNLPDRYLQSLPKATRAHVVNTYIVEVEYQGRNVVRDEMTITAPDQAGINPGLYLNKYCPDPNELKDDKRRLFLEAWGAASAGDGNLVAKAMLERRSEEIAVMGMPAHNFTASVAWRMVLGLGNPNPLETGFSLHPQYGIPWIYGSGAKGIAQSVRLRKIGEELGVYPLLYDQWLTGRQAKPLVPSPLEMLETILLGEAADDEITATFEALKNHPAVAEAESGAEVINPVSTISIPSLIKLYGSSYKAVFGSCGRQGKVTFLDAIPVSGWKYKVDVITPHYGDYYGDKTNKTPPADWLTPKPVTFITLDKGSQFRFDVFGTNQTLEARPKSPLACLNSQGIRIGGVESTNLIILSR